MNHIERIAIVCALLIPAVGFADKDNSNAERPKKVHFKLDLNPSNPDLSDLDQAHGKLKFRFKPKKNKTELEAKISIPLPASELGINSQEEALNADLRIEFLRDGSPIAECNLEPKNQDQDDDEAKFKLKVKTIKHGQETKQRHGNCFNGVPALKKGDQAVAYALVAGNRIDFLESDQD